MIRMIRERLVYSEPTNRWARLFFDDVEFADGAHGRYNRLVEGKGLPAVAILPISASRVGLFGQYRYPIGEWAWEIPRGNAEGPDQRVEADRELREETGVVPEELLELGFIYPNSGILATRVYLFAARCGPESTGRDIYGGESGEFKWFSLEEVRESIKQGVINDAFTLAALLRAQLSGIV